MANFVHCSVCNEKVFNYTRLTKDPRMKICDKCYRKMDLDKAYKDWKKRNNIKEAN